MRPGGFSVSNSFYLHFSSATFIACKCILEQYIFCNCEHGILFQTAHPIFNFQPVTLFEFSQLNFCYHICAIFNAIETWILRNLEKNMKQQRKSVILFLLQFPVSAKCYGNSQKSKIDTKNMYCRTRVLTVKLRHCNVKL